MSDTGNFGYGQQNPNDSSSDFNVISFIVRQMIARLDTMKLVQVKAVHGGAGAIDKAGTVDVLPLVKQIDGNGNTRPHGIVNGIPWSRIQGGKNAVICDPEVDDIGYVVASDRDISTVKSALKQSNPGSYRRYNIADGVYVGGCLNVAPEQYLVFTADGVRLVDKSGNSVAMSSTGIVITPKSGQPVKVSGSLIVTGNLQLGGLIEGEAGGTYSFDIKTSGEVYRGWGGGDQIGLGTHKHTQGPDSHGDAEAATAAPTAGS